MRKPCGIFLFTIIPLWVGAQQLTYIGKIREQNGQPVPFATVLVKNTKNVVAANAEGIFSIQAKNNDTLVFSAVNFLPLQMSAGAETEIPVTLTRGDATLPDVLVTTAFDVKREQHIVPYSAQVINPETINIIPQTNINDALVGKVAGS